MSTTQMDPGTTRQPLRLWPGVIAALLLCVLRYVVPLIVPDAFLIGMLGGFVCAAAIILWWLFFSRAPWVERIGAVVVSIVAFFAIRPLLHESIAGGMMGMMFPVSIPLVLTPAFVAWAVATRRMSDPVRRASMVATIFLACGAWTLVRTEGIFGSGGSQLAWRWTKAPEQRLLAQTNDEPVAPPPTPAAVESSKEPTVTKTVEPAAAPAAPHATNTPSPVPAVRMKAEWPGFRGPDRNGIARAVRIATDWSAAPPVEMWRRPVGPGWSSFAVSGDLVYTQEQRGDDEVVSCYRKSTGQPVWRHRDRVRFWESNAGAGPRATPTLANGRVYAFGATGILNALDAYTGAVVWSRDVAKDVGRQVPMWGFSSSPLIVDDVVIVAASGTLVGYDASTGNRRWSGPKHGASYSSPQLSTIDGVQQILLLSVAGVTSVAPATGAVLWEHSWPGDMTVVQPAVVGNGEILISTSGGAGGLGTRRLAVARKAAGWTVEERWTSTGLKPYFNDFVVHKGYAFGFDGNILSCIDLNDGTRKWKGGRFGNGQLVLLPEQDLLLVISEEGVLALVKATPDQFTEVARFPAIEGKTWNHPVVVGDVVLVRNDQMMAAFRLSRETSDK